MLIVCAILREQIYFSQFSSFMFANPINTFYFFSFSSLY